jgi:hypothetical protein
VGEDALEAAGRQAKHYLDSYPYFFAAARDGRVFGECPLPCGWERQIADPEAIVYSWVFHQMDGPPVTVAIGRARQ